MKNDIRPDHMPCLSWLSYSSSTFRNDWTLRCLVFSSFLTFSVEHSFPSGDVPRLTQRTDSPHSSCWSESGGWFTVTCRLGFKCRSSETFLKGGDLDCFSIKLFNVFLALFTEQDLGLQMGETIYSSYPFTVSCNRSLRSPGLEVLFWFLTIS